MTISAPALETLSRFLMVTFTAVIAIIGNASADSLVDQMIQLGASKARDCLKVATSAGPYRADKMHGYADCLKSVASPIEYSSVKEKAVDSGVFIAGLYILKREFGEIDQKSYGTLGTLQFNEIDAGYKWALSYLKEQGTGKEAACAAIEWVDCKVLP